MTVLDLFSAACGGWSLGLHRAGFQTVAACEAVEWRRILYSENNPDVRFIYDDVKTLTAARLLADLGTLPDCIVGSPPCQDISSANTKGKGVDGERSGLFFEAVRLIGECRPRWFALENSANLRTRGSDAVLSALEEIGYTVEAFVVGAGDGKIAAGVGANHERARSWLIGFDAAQLADSNGVGRHEGRGRRWSGLDVSVSQDTGDAAEDRRGQGLSGRRPGAADEPEQPPCGDASHADGQGEHASSLNGEMAELRRVVGDCGGQAIDPPRLGHEGGRSRRHGPDGDGATSVAGGAGTAACIGQVGLRPADRLAALGYRADWSLNDLAGRLRVDDGLPAWVADARIAVGGPRGTAAASLIVEAFGDAVVPQIPEAIGRAILRTEAAFAAVHSRAAA